MTISGGIMLCGFVGLILALSYVDSLLRRK